MTTRHYERLSFLDATPSGFRAGGSHGQYPPRQPGTGARRARFAALAGGRARPVALQGIAVHLDGPCGRDRSEALPALSDCDEASGRFTRRTS